MRMTNEHHNHALARRWVAMGLSTSAPVFPEDGASFLELAPWWRFWPCDPVRQQPQTFGAGVFPAASSGILYLGEDAKDYQAVITALLPIYSRSTLLRDWVGWIKASCFERNSTGPSPLFGVLEHLLQGQPQAKQAAVWAGILETLVGSNGAFNIESGSPTTMALLDALARTPQRTLIPRLVGLLNHPELDVMLAVLVNLVASGVPDDEVPAEVLLNRAHPDHVESLRAALAYVETGDVDLLSALLKSLDWRSRVQCLRLSEEVGHRTSGEFHGGSQNRSAMVDLLTAQLQQEDDYDVVRCLARTLGITLRGCQEPAVQQMIQLAVRLTDSSRLESLLNAFLIADLPPATAPLIETLRSHALSISEDAVHALNRVMTSMGDPVSTIDDWLRPELIVFLQAGVVRLPEGVRTWFDKPGQCPEEVVVAWLMERDPSPHFHIFCAAYLTENPGFLRSLERIWMRSARSRNVEHLQAVGALIAGARDDCAIAPAELRCCLGFEVGAALPDSPETVGQLIGLLATQHGSLRSSAEDLLALGSPATRTLVGNAMRWMEKKASVFDGDHRRRIRFGVPLPVLSHECTLAEPLQPPFLSSTPPGQPHAERILNALALPGELSLKWVQKCLDWNSPQAVESAFLHTSTQKLAVAILRASSSPRHRSRQLAAKLLAGIGRRILEMDSPQRIEDRAMVLAVHDPDLSVRTAGRDAVAALGLGSLLPALALAPDAPSAPTAPPAGSEDDIEIEDLLREFEIDD